MNQILCSRWLLEGSWRYLAHLGLPAESHKKNFLKSHILILNPLLTETAGHWSDFFVSLWTSTLSWSIDIQKLNLANI